METLELVPYDSAAGRALRYEIDFTADQRRIAGIGYRRGTYGLSGPVARKNADAADARARLERELDVARYLRGEGGELLSRCLAYNFADPPPSILVTYRGEPLADWARKQDGWPLDHRVRAKLTTDLLEGLDVLRVHSIVHGAIGMDTIFWDGGTLQITDFGHAALRGTYPDGSPAHHGDDVAAACRVIYQVQAGAPPPEDPLELRRQLEQVQDRELHDLLIRRAIGSRGGAYYAFADLPEQRPTSRDLLDHLDQGVHGIQPAQILKRDRAVRADFRRLRARQQDFQQAYEPWAARRPAGRLRRLPVPSAIRSAADGTAPDQVARQAPATAGVPQAATDSPARPRFTLGPAPLYQEVPPSPAAPPGPSAGPDKADGPRPGVGWPGYPPGLAPSRDSGPAEPRRVSRPRRGPRLGWLAAALTLLALLILLILGVL